jgi:hypothetical protein
MSVNLGLALALDPPTTTQLRPPHPALVCFLAATLHSPLLSLHKSSPSPNSLPDLLFCCQLLSVGAIRRVPSFTSESWRGPFKTRLCLETAASQTPQDDHSSAPGFTCKGTSTRVDSAIHSGIQIYYTRRSLPHSHHIRNGGPVECAREDIGR